MEEYLRIDPVREAARIAAFVRKVVKSAGASGVVIGVSGGVDSAVTGSLCVLALGKKKVVAALLPSGYTPKVDIEDAEELTRAWDVKTIEIKIAPLADRLSSAAGLGADRVARGNVQARVRMTLLYAIANSTKLLVAGTGDRSEVALGFFTRWGDGGVDFLPIAHLYKTQVRALGRHLGLPSRIVNKPASPQLWPGHTAAEELPADYEELDCVLHYLVDRRLSPAEVARKTGVDPGVVEEVVAMNRKSAYKRALPPSLLRGSQEIRFISAKD